MATKPPTAKPPAAATKPRPKPMAKAPPARVDKPTHVAKSFSVKPLTGEGEGEKILAYAKSGTGKTTLVAQLDGAVFIPLDDGARKIANPITGEAVAAIDGVETWQDLRDAVRQSVSLVPKGGSLVVDTITRAIPLCEAYVIENVPLEKGGKARNLEQFGYGKGYRHVLDQFRLLLTDFDTVIRSGRNVILIAQLDQATVPNAAGVDYYEDVPKLTENKQGPIRTEICEWVDHVFRIGYDDMEVTKDNDQSRVGKVTGDSSRAIFTGGAQYYMAKSRPIDGRHLPPIISFDSPEDNSLWLLMFEGAEVDG